MTSMSTGYDLLASQFSPDGQIFQIEYAQKAVLRSGTAIGLRGKDCVVLATEKIAPSKLYESHAINRIFTVDSRIGAAIAGFIPDGHHLVERARAEAAKYKTTFRQDIPLKHLADRVAMYVHSYTIFGALRPFGVSVMMASYSSNGPELTCIDPSGTLRSYFGCAIGKSQEPAKNEIETLDLKRMTSRELVKEAAKIIYMIHEGKDKHFELELSWVGRNTKGRHVDVPMRIFREAENYALAAVEERDFDEL